MLRADWLGSIRKSDSRLRGLANDPSSNLVGCITGTSLGLVPFTRPALGARHERRRNRAKQDGTLRQLVAR
jgi:hypothetical protein